MSNPPHYPTHKTHSAPEQTSRKTNKVRKNLQPAAFFRRLLPLLPIIILVLLPFIFFFPVFLGKSITAGSLSGSDLMDLHYPARFVLSEHIKNLQLPLWEPGTGTGYPFLAEGQTGVFFLPNLIFSLLPLPVSLNATIITVFIMAALSMYYYLTTLKLKSYPAFFGAIIFAFSAFFTTRYQHINMVNTAALFPALLAVSHNFLDRRKGRYLIFGALLVNQIFCAGHPQMAFYILFIYLIYLCGIVILKKTKDSLFLSLLQATIALIVGTLLSAVQLLPTAELALLSGRQQFTDVTLMAYPYHPSNLITFIAPYFFGNPALGSYKASIQLQGLFWENASYVGLIPLALAGVALVRLIFKKDKNPYLFFISLLGLVSMLLVLGKFSLLFPMLLKVVPLLDLFRFPTRFNLFVIFSLSVLAAFTFSNIKRPAYRIMLIIFAILDLLLFSNQFTGYLNSSDLMAAPPLLKDLDTSSPFRFYSLTQYGESPYQSLGWKNADDAILNIRKALPPDNNLIFAVNSFTNRGWFEGGLTPQNRYDLEQYLTYEAVNNPMTYGKILGMYNIKYLVSFIDNPGVEITQVAQYDLGKNYTQKLNLYENMQVLPRLFFTPEAKVITGFDEFKETINDNNYLPTKTVILSDRPQELPKEFSGVMDDFIKNNPMSIKSYHDTRVEISADIKDHGFMVLSDLYYPGWQAVVDGRKVPILKANYISRAVELWPGKHEIVFKYEPWTVKVGAGISLGTLAGLAGIVIRKLFYSKIQKSNPKMT